MIFKALVLTVALAQICAAKEVLLALGGDDWHQQSNAEVLDPTHAESTWRQVAKIPDGRTAHAAAVLPARNLVMVCGGSHSLDYMASRFSVRSSCVKYEPNKGNLGEWSEFVARMQLPRQTFTLTELSGKLYAVGGHTESTDTHTVERYDPVTNSWSFVAALPVNMSNHGAAAIGGQIYVAGGESGIKTLNTLYRYDSFDNKWTRLADMPQGKTRFGMVAVSRPEGDFLYVIGGYQGHQPLATVERYNLKTGRWEADQPALEYARDDFGAAATLDGTIWVAGGFDGSSFINSVEKLAVGGEKSRWQRVAGLNENRSGLALVVINKD